MKAKGSLSVLAVLLVGWLLVSGISAFAQLNLNVNGNVNLTDMKYAYQITGNNVLRVNSAGVNGTNLFVGRSAGANTANMGNPNVFVGSLAGYKNIDGGENSFMGYQSGYNNNGSLNTFTGFKAGWNNTTGGQNTFTGDSAGYFNTTGAQNVFDGYFAGYSNATGQKNTILGVYAGFGNTAGSYNLFLGNSAGNRSGSNNIYVGSSGPVESNTQRLGMPLWRGANCPVSPCGISATYIAGVYGASITSGEVVFIDSNGKLATRGPSLALGAQEDMIRSQAKRIEDLELRLSRLEALMAQK